MYNSESVVLGKHIEIAENAWLDPDDIITIGDHTYIAGGVVIYRHSHRVDKYLWGASDETKYTQPLKIGNNVFIGRDALILFQCTSIGDNVVVGARSVVTRNIPSNTICAGNPARIVRKRNIVDGIDQLARGMKGDTG